MSSNVSIVNGHAVFKDKPTGIWVVKHRKTRVELAHETNKRDAFKAARMQEAG